MRVGKCFGECSIALLLRGSGSCGWHEVQFEAIAAVSAVGRRRGLLEVKAPSHPDFHVAIAAI